MSIVEHLADPALFGPWFKDPKSWRAWRVVLKALFGDRLTTSERKIFTQLTGRTKPPTKRVQESWWIVGRRGGKSFMTALVATYLACFEDYSKYLSPGEVATVMILAADRKHCFERLAHSEGRGRR